MLGTWDSNVTYLRTDPLTAIFTFDGPFDDIVVTRPGV